MFNHQRESVVFSLSLTTCARCEIILLDCWNVKGVRFWIADYRSQNYVTIGGQSGSLYLCQAPSGAQDQIFVTVSECGFFYVGRPLVRGDRSVVYNCCWSSAAQSFTAVKISTTCYLYLQFYMSAFYSHLPVSLWIPIIYSFTCNSSIYVYKILWHMDRF
jgi:hypothetical protein